MENDDEEDESHIGRRTRLKNGDIREARLKDATFVWSDNLCFPPKVLERQFKQVANAKKTKTFAFFHPVVSLRLKRVLEQGGFTERAPLVLPQTFTNSSAVSICQRD